MRTRIVALGAVLAALVSFSCARDHAAPTSDPASLVLRVSFTPAQQPLEATAIDSSQRAETSHQGDPDVSGERNQDRQSDNSTYVPAQNEGGLHSNSAYRRSALINMVRARAIDLEGGEVIEESIELSPSDTRFELELVVPPDRDYRIEVGAFGTRETEGRSTESGLLYSGFETAYGVSTDEPTVVPIVLENRVPFLDGEVASKGIALAWSQIPRALGYRIRETNSGETRDFLVAGLDTLIALPPGRGAHGGEVSSFRVRSELPEGSSAFSEAWTAELPGPVPPSAVLDLAAGVVTPNSIELRWTAPGDDGDVGQAAAYDLRRSDAPIDEENFAFAVAIPDLPSPAVAGSPESLMVSGLEPGTLYYFALRSMDEVPLSSPISNVLAVSTSALDTTPPDPASSLMAASATESTLELVWVATGDDGFDGIAAAYALRIALFPIDEANFGLAAPVLPVPLPSPPGTPESAIASDLSRDTLYYFALQIMDDADNVSPLTTGMAQTADQTLPGAIVLSAEAISETEMRLDWTAPGDDGDEGQAVAYDLRISDVPLDPIEWETAAPIEGVPSPELAGAPQTMTISDLASDTRYFFAIRAIDNAKNIGPFSDAASDTTLDLTPPASISDLTATPGSETSVHLEWSAPGDDGAFGQAAAYDLRYATFFIDAGNFDEATRVKTTPPQVAQSPESAEITDLEIDVTYYFAVRASDNAGNFSELSNIATATPTDVTPPAAVTDLTLLETQPTQVSVTWTAPGDDGDVGSANAYDLRYATFPLNADNFGDASMVADVPTPSVAGTPETAVIPGLQPRTGYHIALVSVDERGNPSALSNVLQVDTGQPAPEAPTDLAASPIGFDGIALTWIDVANDEDVYEVERRTLSSEFTLIATLEGPFSGVVEHIDTDLTERTDYLYRVRARNQGGASDYSNEAETRTGMAPPTALFADGTSASSIALSWEFGFDPAGFRIERRTGTLSFVEIAQAPGDARAWLDEGLDPTTTYTYRVRGYDSFGESPYSEEASATTHDLDPLCEVRPSALDFGVVEAGFVKTRSFEIENIGGGLLSGVVSASCDGAWSIVEGSGPYSLAAGESLLVRIQFAPAGDGPYACSIDAGLPCGTVECTGQGMEPRGFWADGFGPGEDGVNASVRAFFTYTPGDTVALGGDELLIVGGDFTVAAGLPHSHVAAWDGNTWVEMDGGLPGPVYAFGDYFGQLHAGGSFLDEIPTSGGYPKRRIAYWIPGFTWDGTPEYPDNTIRTIAPMSSSLLVGGDFLSSELYTLNFVAEFLDGVVQPIGPPDFPGVNGQVRAAIQHGSFNVIAGDFTVAGVTSANRIALCTETTFFPLGSGLNGPVYALASDGTNIYAGGDFTMAGGVPARGIAVWNGSNWNALDPTFDFRPVRALHWFDGELIAGGSWELGDPELPLNRIASWNGQVWRPLGYGIDNGEVLAISSYNGSLFVGGTFAGASGLPGANIARWDPNTGRRSQR